MMFKLCLLVQIMFFLFYYNKRIVSSLCIRMMHASILLKRQVNKYVVRYKVSKRTVMKQKPPQSA